MNGFQEKRASDQGCILAPDAFNVAMDRVLGRTVAGTRLGASIGEALCTDFDFADDVALMSEVFDVLLSALTTSEEEVSELGLHTNWQKTKVQSLSDFPASTKPASQGRGRRGFSTLAC